MRRVLSIDGGGVRGIIPAVWCAHLETQLGRPLYEVFDVIAGTSTGALIACVLGAGIPAARLPDLYIENARTIFPGTCQRLLDKIRRIPTEGFSSPKYDPRGLESVLRDTLGALVLADAKTRLVLPTYSLNESRAVVLDSEVEDHKYVFMHAACRASSAAPTFFAAQPLLIPSSPDGEEHVLIDGGVAINDPALAGAMALVDAGACNLHEIEIVSFGTGKSPPVKDKEFAMESGIVDWGLDLVSVLLDAGADHTGYLARRLFRDQYHRVQCFLPQELYKIDNASPSNLRALVGEAEKHLSRVEAIALKL